MALLAYREFVEAQKIIDFWNFFAVLALRFL